MQTTENHKWFKEVGIKISQEYVVSWAKSLLFRIHNLWNATTELILAYSFPGFIMLTLAWKTRTGIEGPIFYDHKVPKVNHQSTPLHTVQLSILALRHSLVQTRVENFRHYFFFTYRYLTFFFVSFFLLRTISLNNGIFRNLWRYWQWQSFF